MLYDLFPDFEFDCKYLDIKSFNYRKSKQDFSIFHLNIASLSKHKDELETVLSMLNYKFDIIGISETKIRFGIAPTYDINIKGCNTLSTPTESEKGGTLIYMLITLTIKLGKILNRLCTNKMNLNLYLLKLLIPAKEIFYVGVYDFYGSK